MLQQASGGGGGARSYLLNVQDVAAGVNLLVKTLCSQAGTITETFTREHAQCNGLTPP